MDKTSFWWAGLCAVCHPGGGPTEFDRDGELYHDVRTGMFGYERLGKTAAEVRLDGDYSEINTANGTHRMAPWDRTGVAEADCLLCHRSDRTISSGKNMNWIWRAASLRAKDALVDSDGNPVPAYAAAATAGQGWFRSIALANVPPGTPPLATSLDIDYEPGVDGGALTSSADGLRVAAGRIDASPKDYACWGCHVTPEMKKRGREWFDASTDVHYAGLNRLDDADPSNDVPAAESRACVICHPSRMGGYAYDHNIAKGDTTLGTVRDDTDHVGFRDCIGCHDARSPDRHPDAPVPIPSEVHSASHRNVLSCQACHVVSIVDPADLVVDNATTGKTISHSTAAFLSADPVDPASPDRSRWYPSFIWRKDRDGRERVYPMKTLLSIWWGDWDQRGTPGDLRDDVVRPIPLWRVRQITKGNPLPGVTGSVNTRAEIALYVAALKGSDSYGRQVAANPVLVKGGKLWFGTAGGGVDFLEYEGTGIKVESSHPFALNHNVAPASQALGAGGRCTDCHAGALAPTPVFERKILVDPFDEDGNPVYETVRGLLGLDPF